jgi:DNA-directed RNA polymerase specialized sigma24 family protein
LSNFTGTTKSPGAIQKEQMENNSTNIAELHDDFSEQYHRWVQPVFRYLRSCINNHADAEDLTAQTFHALFENKSRYLRAENFKALLFKIARNKLIDQLRKEKAVQLLPLADWITLEDAKSDWSIDQAYRPKNDNSKLTSSSAGASASTLHCRFRPQNDC